MSPAVDNSATGFKKYTSATVVGRAIALRSSTAAPGNAPQLRGDDDRAGIGLGFVLVSRWFPNGFWFLGLGFGLWVNGLVGASSRKKQF